ncbi:MAG: hypothetical protein H6737_01645 [Alphaproteobacteria bacterium]|nr:hypothetical protein [Alphaproteobacteria bacterium]
MTACELDPPDCALTGEIEKLDIRRGPSVPEFVAMLEAPLEGLVVRDGAQQAGTWSLDLSELTADTARLGEQCPDLSLEGRATLTLETTGATLTGTGELVLDSWTVEGWEAEIVSQRAEIGPYTGTLRMRFGGDDFDHVDFSEGGFGGNDGEVSTELLFSTR